MTTLHWGDSRLEVHKVVVGPYDNNVFVLRCRETGEAVLIDAANEHEQLLELCQRARRAPGARDPRPLGPHPGRAGDCARPATRSAVTALDAPQLKDVGYDVFLDDAEVIEVGRLRLHAIHTPGPHAGLDLVQGRAARPLLFTGDTLFPGGPGNTAFHGGDFDDDHRLDRPAPVHVPRRHDRAARPRTPAILGTERPHLQEWIDRGW